MLLKFAQMKYALLSFLLSICVMLGMGQGKDPLENVLITSEKTKTGITTNENGELKVNVSPKDLNKFKSRGWVRYSELGARGDGKTDDIDAIAATHAVANKNGLLVK